MLHGQVYPALIVSMTSGTISWKTSQAGLLPQQTSPGGFKWEKSTWAGLWVGLGAGSVMGYSYSVLSRMSHCWAIVEGKGLLCGQGSYQSSTCRIQVPEYSASPFTDIAMDFHGLSCIIKSCQEKMAVIISPMLIQDMTSYPHLGTTLADTRLYSPLFDWSLSDYTGKKFLVLHSALCCWKKF